MSFESWISGEVQAVEDFFTTEEAAVVKFFGPLITQVVAAVKTLAADDFDAGLAILKDAATKAVQAGSIAKAAGQDVVKTAEDAFVGIVKTEGVTAVNNAESAAIKAAVAITQAVTSTPAAS